MAEEAAPYTANDVAKANHARYLRARDAGHKDYIEHVIKCDRYVLGDQWSDADAKKLAEQNRPAVTINLVLPTVNTAVGEFLNAQADIQYKPKRGPATEEVATTLTKLAMHICDANNYESIEKDVLEDGLSSGRGYFDIRMDYSDNVLGEVRISLLDPKSVIPDPTAARYDPSEWNEVFITKWLSLDEIEVLYGKDKAESLKFASSSGVLINDDSIRFEERDAFGDKHAMQIGAYDAIDTAGRTIREVRVVDRQYYKLDRVREFVDPVNGDIRPVPESWTSERVQLYADAKQLKVRQRVARRIRWTVTADCVMLFDGWSNDQTFTVIPFFCYFRRGKTAGIVKNLIGPQDLVNKVESQVLHVVNTTANSGWVVDTNALANMTVEELAANGAKTGLVIEKNPGTEVDKIQPNTIPTGLDHISTRNVQAMREISGVNAAMMGTEDSEVSGVTLRTLTNRGSVQLATVRENLRRTRKLVARKILDLAQKNYTEERIFYITGYEGDTEQMVINQRDAAGKIANDLTLGEYDVVVGVMPARDTFEESQFAQALELRDIGVMIPDHRVIQYSGLHRKNELMEEVKQLTGFGEPTEEQMIMQQLNLEMLQGQVAELQANIEATMASAELSRAKAYSELQKPAIEREQMRTDMAITAEEQAVRLQVQRLKELSSQVQKILDANVKIRTARAKDSNTTTRSKPRVTGTAKR